MRRRDPSPLHAPPQTSDHAHHACATWACLKRCASVTCCRPAPRRIPRLGGRRPATRCRSRCRAIAARRRIGRSHDGPAATHRALLPAEDRNEPEQAAGRCSLAASAIVTWQVVAAWALKPASHAHCLSRLSILAVASLLQRWPKKEPDSAQAKTVPRATSRGMSCCAPCLTVTMRSLRRGRARHRGLAPAAWPPRASARRPGQHSVPCRLLARGGSPVTRSPKLEVRFAPPRRLCYCTGCAEARGWW